MLKRQVVRLGLAAAVLVAALSLALAGLAFLVLALFGGLRYAGMIGWGAAAVTGAVCLIGAGLTLLACKSYLNES